VKFCANFGINTRPIALITRQKSLGKQILHTIIILTWLDRTRRVDQGTVVRTDLALTVSKIFNIKRRNPCQKSYLNRSICEHSDCPEVASFSTTGWFESWQHWL